MINKYIENKIIIRILRVKLYFIIKDLLINKYFSKIFKFNNYII
jgi:hypothetical protein